MRELEGAFALLFKSNYYPGELVGCKCGSPLLLGIKTNDDDDLEVSMPSPTSRKMMEVEQGGVGLGVVGTNNPRGSFTLRVTPVQLSSTPRGWW